MSAESALVLWVRSDGVLKDLVGPRVYPSKIPQGEILPAITYQKTGRPRLASLTGPSGLAYPSFAVNCYALTYAEAQAVAAAIRGTKGNPRLDGFRGQLGDTFVQGAHVEDGSDSYDPPAHADSEGVHCATLEVTLWVEEYVAAAAAVVTAAGYYFAARYFGGRYFANSYFNGA